MSIPTYNLDTEAAKEGDSHTSRITETGSYKGLFTKAKHFVNDKGTTGIDIAFECVTGATAYFQLYTFNKDGEPIFGKKQLDAIMTCMKVRTLTPSKAMVEEYNRESKQVETVEATVFQELMNKPIGIVFQKEHFIGANGPGSSVKFFAAFNAETQKTASEMIDNLPAEKLDRIMSTIKDKQAKGAAQQTSSYEEYAQQTQTIDDHLDF